MRGDVLNNMGRHSRGSEDVSRLGVFEDKALLILSVLLLIALACASLYGIRYGNVDESVVPGQMTVIEDGEVTLDLNIDDNLNASINSIGFKMTGTLKLAGAEEDTILYQLNGISLEDETDSKGAVFFIRMPRSGLQGDLSGTWMVYCTFPEVAYSKWMFLQEDGSAAVGFKNSTNVITMQRDAIIKISEEMPWSWEKHGSTLLLSSKE